jgi:hypothetical protein
MKEFFKNNASEISFFVAGWCSFAFLDSLIREQYFLAVVNAVLAYANIKIAKL